MTQQTTAVIAAGGEGGSSARQVMLQLVWHQVLMLEQKSEKKEIPLAIS